jgi:hypothetical protein
MRFHRSVTILVFAVLPVACASAPAAPAAVPIPILFPKPPDTSTGPTPPVAAPPAPLAAATTPAAATPAGTAPRPAPPPSALQEALDTALKAIAVGDAAKADEAIGVAAGAAGDDAHLKYLVARVRATRFAYAGDFEGAAAALLAVLPVLAKHPELPDEFWLHNAMMMIREAQGDPAAALAENDQATLCAVRATWNPKGREMLAFQKDRWHRAYLTRMLAESRTGTVKQALVNYAQSALDEYRMRGFPESVAVLEAYFAALDGRGDVARTAAKRVDPAQDGDVEDLYLVVVGLEAGGDHTAAQAVRHVMRQPGDTDIARAIMLRWLDLDAKARGFTPWHARAH